MRRVSPKSLQCITEEWDAIASTRASQLASGQDISFDDVLAPALLAALAPESCASVLDVGCGTGAFTRLLTKRFKFVTGVDPSRRSIEEALASSTNIQFIASSVEDYAQSGRAFEAIAANMTLMDVPDIYSATYAIASLCQTGGIFAFTITHPWFWPLYWGYADADWFKYAEEIFIESEFRTSAMRSGMVTTHVHRPLELYIDAMQRAGFRILSLRELMPSPTVEKKYPSPWAFPRFLLVSCIRL